jgi:hypothetical protein
MLSGCVIALGTKQSSCPCGKHHERLERDADAHFGELEMREEEYAEFPGEQEEHFEQRMRELEMRAEELNQMERHLTERAEELERRAAELEEPEE